MKPERRVALGKAEIRKAGDVTKIVGNGAVFNQETVIGNNFRERIMPGAFKDVVVATADVRSLFNHDANFPLGRTTAGTLSVSEDANGLVYEVTPPVSRADVLESVERGDVTGSSFSFRVAKDGDEWTRSTRAGELPLRTIHRFAELIDVGPVTFPAYPEASAEARSQAEAMSTPVVPPAPVVTPAAARASMTAEQGEEAAELVQYQTAGSALAQARVALTAAEALVAALIANEVDSPTDTADAEAAEEELETAQLRSLLVLCGQVCGAVSGVSALTQAMLSDEWDPILYARTAAGKADEDRARQLELLRQQAVS